MSAGSRGGVGDSSAADGTRISGTTLPWVPFASVLRVARILRVLLLLLLVPFSPALTLAFTALSTLLLLLSESVHRCSGCLFCPLELPLAKGGRRLTSCEGGSAS